MGLGRSLKKAFNKTVKVATLGIVGEDILSEGQKKRASPAAPDLGVEDVRTKRGFASTILTSARGLEDEQERRRRRNVLLGASSKLGSS